MKQKNEILFQEMIEKARSKYSNQEMINDISQYCEPLEIINHIFYILVKSKELFNFLQDINLSKFNEIATSIYQDKIEIEFIDDKQILLNKLKEKKGNLDVKSSEFDKNLTFSSYVVGEYNQIAVNLLNRIIKEDKVFYNPVFLYGITGIGKTHLVNAFAIDYLKKFPERKIKMFEGSHFLRYVQDLLINSKNIENFKKECSLYDVLIIDDVQYLSKKEKTQEIFFDIFNDLIKKGHLIIMTSDTHPEQMTGFHARIISRLNSGVSIELKVPSENVIDEIIKGRLKDDEIVFSDDGLEYIRKYYTHDIRNLLGKINTLVLFNIDKQILNKEDIKKYLNLDDNRTKEKNYENLHMNPSYIINAVAKLYEIPKSEITGNSRKQNIQTARMMAMWIMKNQLDISLKSIGSYFNKEHSTVLHATNRFEELIKEREDLANAAQIIIKNIK